MFRRKTLKLFTGSNNNICFFHIPKTAGGSVIANFSKSLGMRKLNRPETFLKFNNRGCVTFGHVHYLSLLKSGWVSEAYHKNSYKFSIVRCPYERTVSLYNYLVAHRQISIETGARDWTFDHFLDQVMYKRPPVGLYSHAGISHTNPQVDWILNEDGNLIVDEIFRIDDLQSLYAKFSASHGVEFDDSIHRKNSISRKNSQKLVTVESNILEVPERVEKVNFIYARDFELLGFDRISSSESSVHKVQ